ASEHWREGTLFCSAWLSSPLPPSDLPNMLPGKGTARLPPSLSVIQVSSGCVSKILTRYYKVGIVQPKTREGSRPQIATPQLVAVIAQLKQERPSLFAWEIREKLEAAGTCAASRIPSVSCGGRTADTGPLCRDVAPANLWPRTLQPLGRRAPASLWPLAALTRSFPLSAFQRSQYPEAAARAELAGQSGLPEATLKVWFSNRRARWRREAMRAQHAGSGPATPGTHLACGASQQVRIARETA
uniref:Paired box 4 n=1 Tax=Laticauda laticaudata TaxID=8630 RepID=A0A8C5RCV7_LATLA